MKILKSVGGFANDWAKFVATLAALGWFAVYAFDRVAFSGTTTPQTEIQNDDASVTDASLKSVLVAQTPASETTSAKSDSSAKFATSVWSLLGKEMFQKTSSIFSSPIAQFALCMVVGTGAGLAARPAANKIAHRRKISAAKRRARIQEQDRQLLLAEVERPTATRSAAGTSPAQVLSSMPEIDKVLAPGV